SGANRRARGARDAAVERADQTAKHSNSVARRGPRVGTAVIAQSSRGDPLPEPFPPLALELRRDARDDGLFEALDVRLDHRHPSGLERVDKLRLLREDLVVLRLAVLCERRL